MLLFAISSKSLIRRVKTVAEDRLGPEETTAQYRGGEPRSADGRHPATSLASCAFQLLGGELRWIFAINNRSRGSMAVWLAEQVGDRGSGRRSSINRSKSKSHFAQHAFLFKQLVKPAA